MIITKLNHLDLQGGPGLDYDQIVPDAVVQKRAYLFLAFKTDQKVQHPSPQQLRIL